MNATTWMIFDTKEQREIGMFKNRARANNKADKMNLEYGAHRYTVRTIYN